MPELLKTTAREAAETMLNLRGNTSVSLVVPLLHASPDHHEDWSRIDKSISEALDELERSGLPKVTRLKTRLKNIAPLISFNRNNKGLGIFISDTFFYMVFFPFAVKESVLVSDRFQMKELFRLCQFSGNALMLTVSSKKARLFRVSEWGMEELKDDRFPLLFSDDAEYNYPSRSTSYSGSAHVKSFEKDKSITRKRKFREFIHKADELIDPYLSGVSECIICGTAPHIAAFKESSKHASSFVTELVGGYDWYDASEYFSLLMPVRQTRMGEKVIDMLEYYSRRAGEGFAEYGMTQVWSAVKEGRVDTLLVENGYETEGFVHKDNASLFEAGILSSEGHYFYPLAVNELIQLAALQQANLFFLDKDLMPGDAHVAAICRY